MKPITHWVENEAIDALVDQFGQHLENLLTGDRRDLIACLAHECNYYEGQIADVDAAYQLVAGLTRHEKDLLMEAIAATLPHQGNPWLETAREMVAIEQRHAPQKTGTPSP